MRENYIELRFMQREVEEFYPTLLEGQFEFDSRAKCPWLQKICFYILKKLGSQKKQEKVVFNNLSFPLDDLMQAVYDHRDNVSMLLERRVKYIIIGSDIFSRFTKLEEFREPHFLAMQISDNYKSKLRINGVYCEGILQGLYVIYVPWINGMFCLPEIKAD